MLAASFSELLSSFDLRLSVINPKSAVKMKVKRAMANTDSKRLKEEQYFIFMTEFSLRGFLGKIKSNITSTCINYSVKEVLIVRTMMIV